MDNSLNYDGSNYDFNVRSTVSLRELLVEVDKEFPGQFVKFAIEYIDNNAVSNHQYAILSRICDNIIDYNFKNKHLACRLEIDGQESISLTNCRCLAVLPSDYAVNLPVTCYGINVALDFEKEPISTKKYIESILPKNVVHGIIVKNDLRVPVDIHGGNTDETYFGYINTTIFD